MSAIFKRDLRAYFKSPLGYVYLAAFVLVLNIYFYLMNVYSGSSSLDGIFSFIVTMCVFLIPILTMRTFAEDYKQKTDQLLFTAPVRLTGIVMGCGPLCWASSLRRWWCSPSAFSSPWSMWW